MRGGTSYTIVLTFDRNVSAATSTTVAAGIGTVGSTTFSGNTATISLTDVSDRQTITVELDNVVGAVGTNSKVLVSMSVLVCDVDQSGSVTSADLDLVAAHSGSVVDSNTFQYDTTHNGAISSGDIYFTSSRETGTLYPDFAFTGHYYHARSGLYLAPYRAYNPTVGRWLSRDPIGSGSIVDLGNYRRVALVPRRLLDPTLSELASRSSVYTYVHNDPVRWTDRVGLCIDCVEVKQSTPWIVEELGPATVTSVRMRAWGIFTFFSGVLDLPDLGFIPSDLYLDEYDQVYTDYLRSLWSCKDTDSGHAWLELRDKFLGTGTRTTFGTHFEPAFPPYISWPNEG
jgi:RHS repeat-associated protein